MNTPITIPVYQPTLGEKEKDFVLSCLETNWISSKGEFVTRFENTFAKYVNIDYATSICNGTAALHLALLALGIGDGDEVIVPSLTYIASVNAITYTGAKPIFVDSLQTTWQVDPDEVERSISERSRAIMAVHLYGHPCDMDALKKIADKYKLFLIEDCAEALGSRYRNQHVGTFGDVAIFSFYGNKTITTGEGGMLITNDQTIYERAVRFKGQGLAQHREYWHEVVGYNYRMTNICSAIGLAQLDRIEDILTKKKHIAELYKCYLQDCEDVCVHIQLENVYHSYWMVSILVTKASMRDTLRAHLRTFGVETRPVFFPVHTMPMYSQKYIKLSIAEDIGRRGINLPSYPDLLDSQVEFICSCINVFFDKVKPHEP